MPINTYSYKSLDFRLSLYKFVSPFETNIIWGSLEALVGRQTIITNTTRTTAYL